MSEGGEILCINKPTRDTGSWGSGGGTVPGEERAGRFGGVRDAVDKGAAPGTPGQRDVLVHEGRRRDRVDARESRRQEQILLRVLT